MRKLRAPQPETLITGKNFLILSAASNATTMKARAELELDHGSPETRLHFRHSSANYATLPARCLRTQKRFYPMGRSRIFIRSCIRSPSPLQRRAFLCCKGNKAKPVCQVLCFWDWTASDLNNGIETHRDDLDQTTNGFSDKRVGFCLRMADPLADRVRRPHLVARRALAGPRSAILKF